MNTLRKTLLALAVAVGALLTFPSIAFGAPDIPDVPEGPKDPEAVVVSGGSALEITQPVWLLITGILLPILVGAVTKYAGRDDVKAIVGIVVAAVAALVLRMTQYDGSAIFDPDYLLDVALVYVPQLASYLGFWRNLGTNEHGKGINAFLAPEKGLG
jgi:hypothetical protein